MVTTLGWFYLVGGTILFFFWAYGIVSFALDCKNKFIPAIRRAVAARRERRREREYERDPERERATEVDDAEHRLEREGTERQLEREGTEREGDRNETERQLY